MRNTLLIGLLGLATLQLSGCAPIVVGGVGAGALMADDRRTPTTYLMDEEIEITATARLFNAKLDGVHANYTSFNRRVLITGEASTEAGRAKVEETAKGVVNVREIINEIAIASPSSLVGRSNDGYITAKVKTRLFEDKRFNANHIKVVTERGIVYLMGLVKRAEGDAAAEVAAGTGGVLKVVKVFEYID
ncbi:MAG: BON domain-containing protein [Hydrogenophilaceae bacterium]|nr:BON domain-containing protein [Hydrogenophilaceae bacterium]